MSSLEEPLGLDKLPSMCTIDRIQRFSSAACRPRVDNLGMGNCWIEGRSCSTSNSCEWVKNCNLLQVKTDAYIFSSFYLFCSSYIFLSLPSHIIYPISAYFIHNVTLSLSLVQWRQWRVYSRDIPVEKANKGPVPRRLFQSKDNDHGEELDEIWNDW